MAARFGGRTVFTLVGRPPAVEHLTVTRIVAIALAVALTTGAMLVLGAPHPPAASTALLVALGIITSITELLALAGGVMVLLVQGYVLDHLVGLDYPAWARRRRSPSP